MARLYAGLAVGTLFVVASALPSPASTPQGPGYNPTLSPDGHYLFFETSVFDNTGQTRLKRTLATGVDTPAPLPMLPTQSIAGALAVTPSERYIAYAIVDGNSDRQVIVLDTVTNTTSIESLTNAGQVGAGDSDEPSMSDDGRYVVFLSAANLVPGDSNGSRTDVFVRDRCISDGAPVSPCTPSTQLVSLGPAGIQTADGCEMRASGAAQSISADGRYVVFSCGISPAAAGAFAPGHACNDPLVCTGIFVRDRCVSNGVPVVPCTAATELVSQGAGGAFPNNDSSVPVISGDGTRVVYSSLATDIVAETPGSFTADVFLYDRNTQTTQRLTTPPAQGEILFASNLSASSDGLHVVYKRSLPNGAASSQMYLWADCLLLNPTCGDGVFEPGCEACEDANLVDGDGCDSNCTPTGCGNGITTTGEQCDDGNPFDGDGCDTNCTPTSCGNDIVTDPEDCDDGNTTPGDGCSPTCGIEPGELTPGGTGKTDCVHEWFPNPQPPKNTKGIPSAVLQCRDDDPTCDFDNQPGDNLCVFRLALCLNVTDPRLPCTPSDVAGVDIVKPKAENPNDPYADFNRVTLEFSLGQLGGIYRGRCQAPAANFGDECFENADCDDFGGDGKCSKPLYEFGPLTDTNLCSEFSDVVVPVKTTASGLKPGKVTLKLKALTSADPVTGRPKTDADTLKLVCNPGP